MIIFHDLSDSRQQLILFNPHFNGMDVYHRSFYPLFEKFARMYPTDQSDI